MMENNPYFIPTMELPMFAGSNEIPINRYGILFLIENEFYHGNERFVDFELGAVWEIIRDLITQSTESEINPLCNLLGMDITGILEVIDEIPDISPNMDTLHFLVLDEIMLYFSEEIHDLCQFVRDRLKDNEGYVFLDKQPLFCVSFSPYPDMNDFLGETQNYGELH
jgi:hypothetical protein